MRMTKRAFASPKGRLERWTVWGSPSALVKSWRPDCRVPTSETLDEWFHESVRHDRSTSVPLPLVLTKTKQQGLSKVKERKYPYHPNVWFLLNSVFCCSPLVLHLSCVVKDGLISIQKGTATGTFQRLLTYSEVDSLQLISQYSWDLGCSHGTCECLL